MHAFGGVEVVEAVVWEVTGEGVVTSVLTVEVRGSVEVGVGVGGVSVQGSVHGMHRLALP